MEVARVLRQVRDGQADLVDFTKLLSAYGKTQKWFATLHGLTALAASNLSPDTYAFNVAAASCHDWSWTLQLLGVLPLKRLKVDNVSCGVMMSALKKGSQASRACDLLTELQKQSIQLGVQSYNIVISAFADEARWPQALQLALSLSFRHVCALDDFARTKLLTMQRLPWRLGLTFVADGGAEAFRSALQMVGATQWTLTLDAFAQNLRSRRLEPSLGQLATLPWRTSMEELQKIPVVPGPPRDLLALLRSAAQQSAPAAALASLAALPRAVAAYGAVLGRCAEEKNWTLALALLETMQVENVQKDCLCFSSMMDATSTRVEWLRALAIFEGLKEALKDSKDLDEDLDLLGSVSIQSCSSHWPCSLQLLRSLRRSTLRPQLLSYTSLSTLLGDVGDDWRQALQVLQHAQEQRVAPNNSLLSSVAATLRVGTWRVTNELLRMATTRQVEIYTSCFNACIGVCAAPAWPQALLQLQTLASRLLASDRLTNRSLQRGPWSVALLASQLDIATMNGAASAALVAGKWHRSLEVLRAAARYGLQCDTVSKYLLMHAQSRRGASGASNGAGRGRWQIPMSILANAENRNLSDLYRAPWR
ncbi:unnamed protein product [Cladocopium goreaui]|uniref:Pentatricopeptide repeat-containing protein, chloroplastic n=1 Tax=Cladocopium goreaui TaxID=2562237 RepID=A0A9P1DC09_9DINO|nr:unnamed protein product [Cladocopium goreaui]